jgi:hypothetical protein
MSSCWKNPSRAPALDDPGMRQRRGGAIVGLRWARVLLFDKTSANSYSTLLRVGFYPPGFSLPQISEDGF